MFVVYGPLYDADLRLSWSSDRTDAKVSAVQPAEPGAAHVPAAAGIVTFISSWPKAFTATEFLCVVDTPVFTGNSSPGAEAVLVF